MKTETKYRLWYLVWLVIGIPVCVLFSPVLVICMFLTIKGDIEAAMDGVNGAYRAYRTYVKKGTEI